MKTEERKAYEKAWFLAHPGYQKAHNKAYYLAHIEDRKEYMKAYCLAYPEQREVSVRAYYRTHPEQRKASARAYYRTHPEQRKASSKAYRQTPEGKETQKKRHAKRKQFGFIPLNKWFEGSHGHHIDKERVVYIPKDIHESISHSILRNRNMEAINTVAREFLSK